VDEFRDSTDLIGDAEALRERLAIEGYLFFRGVIDSSTIFSLRRKILGELAKYGWLEDGSVAEDAKPGTHRRETDPDWWDGYIAIQSLEEFHQLAHYPTVVEIVRSVIDDDVLVHPRKIARVVFPQRPDYTTPAHQDFAHIQGTPDCFTTWIPLGDAPVVSGGLRILRGSHKRGIVPIHRAAGAGGTATDDRNDDPNWVTTDYRAGDLVMFHSLTVHAGIPNTSDRLRLSSDFRYQSVRQPVCEGTLKPHFFQMRDFPVPDWPILARGWSTTRWIEAPPVEIAPFVSPYEEPEQWYGKVGLPHSDFVSTSP
jgi:hypothetical protein